MDTERQESWSGTRITIALPPEVVALMRRQARAEMVSVAAIARRAIVGYYRNAHAIAPSREEVPA